MAKNKNLIYHAFEPDEKTADVCDLNAFGGVQKTSESAFGFKSLVHSQGKQ